MNATEQQQLLGSILEECDRLTRLTDQLLTLAREDAGVAFQERHMVDLSALLRGVAETMRPVAEVKQQVFDIRIDSAGAVRGDEARLRQVFYCLLDNAIKYTLEGGVVTLELLRQDSCAVVTVADTGVGIPADHLPHVCERFYRVDKGRSREMGGTGLGLSIARTIVQAHDGLLELHSEVGKGTTCIVRFPASDAVHS